MIGSEVAIRITFDSEGKEKLEKAIATINETLAAFSKAGGFTGAEEDALVEGREVLNSILVGNAF